MLWNTCTVQLSQGNSLAHRYWFALLALVLLSGNDLLAQPENDSCAVAREIAIPFQINQVFSYSGSNIGATPELPLYYQDCSAGGLFSGFGADVWYTFTPTFNSCLNIEVFGLDAPEFNVIENGNCGQGLELICSSGANGYVSGIIEVNEGTTYLLRMSGGQYSDQDQFTYTISTIFCDEAGGSPGSACLLSDRLTLSPSPDQPGNSYEPGQRVEICYTIEGWAAIADNWIHGVEIWHGAGWDLSTLEYTSPESCNGTGQWEWFDFWTSCNTGRTYGPGFAYDSFQGLGCGGSPFDGDPGNNWGDGPQHCTDTPWNPRQFCWSVTVNDCSGYPDSFSSDLSIEIRVHGDGSSGSWDFDVCDFSFGIEVDEMVSLSANSETCSSETCPIWLAAILEQNVSCPGETDGFVEVFGSADGLGTINVYVYTLNDELLHEYLDVSLPFISPSVLDTGYYGILVEAPDASSLGFCNSGVIDIIHIDLPFELFPDIIPSCNPDSLQLEGGVWPNLADATYHWDGPNDFSSSEQNPFVFEEGTYYFNVRYNGCGLSDSIVVELRDTLPLTVDYWLSPPCDDNPLQLTASGAGTGNSNYEWLDANTGGRLSPNYFAGQDLWDFGPITGDLDLRLVGFDERGCSDTINFTANYFEIPELVYHFTVDDCASTVGEISFPTDSGLSEVFWSDLPDSQNPRSFDNLAPGEETDIPVVISYGEFGCSYFDTVTLVGPGLAIAALDTILCPGESTLVYASSAFDYLWDTGDTTSYISVTAMPGASVNYSVTATDLYGCERIEQITIHSTNLASAAFSYTNDGLHYQFQPTDPQNNDTEYFWNFGDGSSSMAYAPEHTFTAGSSSEVSLLVSTRCGLDSLSQTINLPAAPEAGFTMDISQGCAPLSVQFMNESQGADNYQWLFPGGTPANSTEENPTVSYHSPGIYSVQLIASNAFGISTVQLDNQIEVWAAPNGSFTSSTDDLSVQFTSSANNTDNYLWDFGDGNGSNDPNPLHTYDSSGTYTVSLSISNECDTITITEQVTVIQALPMVAFTTNDSQQGCAPLTVTYLNQSANADTYEWTFAGGVPETSTAMNPTVTYLTAGLYGVHLIATNEAGSSNIELQNFIEVFPTPQGSFTYEDNLLEVNFSSSTTNTDSYLWDFGDDNSSTEPNPTHTYASSGSYTVSLQITNEACGSVLITEEVVVARPIPEVAFTTDDLTQGCAPLSITFINQSLNANSYLWTFPGGEPATSTEVNPTVNYAIPGTYYVQLNATNETGSNALVADAYVEVLPEPSGSFSYESELLEVQFSTTTNNTNSYLWDFGDGNSSTDPNPIHTYETAGEYLVTLTIENDCGSVNISETVMVIVTSLEELNHTAAWVVYPNPNQGTFWIEVTDVPGHLNGSIHIFNALGEQIGQQALTISQGIYRTQITLNLPSGVYWIRLDLDGFTDSYKKIILH